MRYEDGHSLGRGVDGLGEGAIGATVCDYPHCI